MGLLNLPSELRNTVYALVLLDPNEKNFTKYEHKKPREPALLHVNRQIRNEASGIFWGGNTFCFVQSPKAELWLHRLQPHKLAALRSVISSHAAHARIWSMQIVQAKKDLQGLFNALGRKGLRRDVVKLPMRIEGEEGKGANECEGKGEEGEEIVWVSLANIDDFQKSSRAGFVVRKAKSKWRPHFEVQYDLEAALLGKKESVLR